MNDIQTLNRFDIASTAKVHLQEMDDAMDDGNQAAADKAFEKAWQLMRDAQRIRLAEKVKRIEEGPGRWAL